MVERGCPVYSWILQPKDMWFVMYSGRRLGEFPKDLSGPQRQPEAAKSHNGLASSPRSAGPGTRLQRWPQSGGQWDGTGGSTGDAGLPHSSLSQLQFVPADGGMDRLGISRTPPCAASTPTKISHPDPRPNPAPKTVWKIPSVRAGASLPPDGVVCLE